MRLTCTLFIMLCLSVGCAQNQVAPANLEQQALQLALKDYFSAQHWQSKPCYLKKNDFTIQPEYALANGQSPAKVVDLDALRQLAKGRIFGPEWTIIRCLRETKEGRDVMNVELSTTQEKLDPSSKLGAYVRGKFYLYEIKDNSLTLIDSGEWKQ